MYKHFFIAADDGCIIDAQGFRYEQDHIRNRIYPFMRPNGFEPDGAMQFLYPKCEKFYLVSMMVDARICYAYQLTKEGAVRWLLYNNHELPESLLGTAKKLANATI